VEVKAPAFAGEVVELWPSLGLAEQVVHSRCSDCEVATACSVKDWAHLKRQGVQLLGARDCQHWWVLPGSQRLRD